MHKPYVIGHEDKYEGWKGEEIFIGLSFLLEEMTEKTIIFSWLLSESALGLLIDI